MIVLAVVVFHVLGVLSSIHAIMSTRTEQGAVAWAVALNTFPYVAVPAYWVLGRSRFQGYVSARQGEMDEIAGVTDDARIAVREFMLPPEMVSPTARAAEALAGIPSVGGNAVELLVDGDATFASILEGIDAADDYILFQFFIVHDDEIGRDVKTHLIERAKAGVRVYFLYDEVGSHDLPASYKDELREAGIEVYDFHTQKGPGNRFQLNFRNHRKVVVVDGKVAWIGGHNVGDEYLGRDPKFGHWRDTHVRIEGPSALGAQLSFAEDWYWATGRRLDVSWRPVAANGRDVPVLIIPSGPADELETANLMFVRSHQLRERKDLDYQPLLRSGPAADHRAPACRAARRRRAHPDPGHAGPPRRLFGRFRLPRRVRPHRRQVLPLPGRVSAPEGHAHRPLVGNRRNRELRQPVVPAQLRDHGGCRRR